MEAEKLFSQFGLDKLYESFTINLSNGEQRKLELLKALSAKPDLLVLDNAFTGLDNFSRPLLTQMLETLVLHGQSIVMTGLELNDFPPSVKSFVLIKDGLMKGIFTREEVNAEKLEPVKLEIDSLRWPNSGFAELIYLKNVSLQYNERVILDDINWQVNSGERWSLSGPNGSGKTSLLNLILVIIQKLMVVISVCLENKKEPANPFGISKPELVLFRLNCTSICPKNSLLSK